MCCTASHVLLRSIAPGCFLVQAFVVNVLSRCHVSPKSSVRPSRPPVARFFASDVTECGRSKNSPPSRRVAPSCIGSRAAAVDDWAGPGGFPFCANQRRGLHAVGRHQAYQIAYFLLHVIGIAALCNDGLTPTAHDVIGSWMNHGEPQARALANGTEFRWRQTHPYHIISLHSFERSFLNDMICHRDQPSPGILGPKKVHLVGSAPSVTPPMAEFVISMRSFGEYETRVFEFFLGGVAFCFTPSYRPNSSYSLQMRETVMVPHLKKKNSTTSFGCHVKHIRSRPVAVSQKAVLETPGHVKSHVNRLLAALAAANSDQCFLQGHLHTRVNHHVCRPIAGASLLAPFVPASPL